MKPACFSQGIRLTLKTVGKCTAGFPRGGTPLCGAERLAKKALSVPVISLAEEHQLVGLGVST